MASLLYRLGKLAASKRWWFLGSWIVALVAIGAAAALGMGTLSNTFTIPGTPTQITLDKMKKELPELAGGTGSVVFQAKDGTLSASQKDTIADSLKQLKDQDLVKSALDPFAMQKQVDQAASKIEDGKKEIATNQKKLDDGKKALSDGKKKLEDGKKQIATGKKDLDKNQKKLTDSKAQLASGQKQLDAGRQKLASGQKEYKAGLAKYKSGLQQYNAAKAKLATGQKQYNSGVAQLAAGKKKLAAGKAQVAQGEKALPGGQKKLKASEAKLKAGQKEYQAGAAQLKQLQGGLASIHKQCAQAPQAQQAACRDAAVKQAGIGSSYASAQQTAKAGAAKSAAAKKQLDSGAAQLAAGKKELASKTAQLKQAKKALPGAQKKLDAAQSQLATAKKQLSTGRAQLKAGQPTLASAKRKLDAAAQQLATGRSELATNQKKLTDGRAQLLAGQKKLDAGAKTLKDSESKLKKEEAKLPSAQKKLDDGVSKLATARTDLALGERTADASSTMRFVSTDNTTAVSNLQFEGQVEALSAADRQELQDILNASTKDGVEVLYSKEIVSDLNSFFGPGEAIGIIIAAIVLFVMMGTFVAAGLPLLMAILGVGAGVGGTLAFSKLIDMASITPALALMLGLAVGIDYSLFIMHRHRKQMLGGMETIESIARAVGTSGNAVVFAGLTVIIALAALVVPGLPFLSVLGISAAATVAISVLVSITLTPALLSFMGRRIASKRAWRAAQLRREQIATGEVDVASESARKNHRGWGALTSRRPWIFTVVSVLLLAIIALPALSLRTALPDGGQEAYGSSAQRAFSTISERFGGGYNGPLIALVELPEGQSKDQAQNTMLDVADQIRPTENVVAVIPAKVNDDRTFGAVQIIPKDGPSSASTEALVHSLRDKQAQIKEATGASVDVTGQVGAQIDVSEKVTQALAPYLAIVVGLSLVLLLLVFRSVVVPLLATAGFLLSLTAAFGATVAVYQWGWFGPVFDVHATGPIMSFLPILLTGILFGLAMDYQVFLVSSMREAYAHGADPRDAVRNGFRASAPVVTAAALIMTSVFSGFVFSHLAMIRPIGFALAVGVLADAFVVRMTLTPAVMTLLGKHAWYIPKWLDRILPDVDVEGAKLQPTASGHGSHGAHVADPVDDAERAGARA